MAKDLIKQLCCWQRDMGYRQVTELQGKGGKWKGWGIREQQREVSRDLGRGKTWDWGYRDTPDIFLAYFSCCPTNPVCPTEPRRSSLKPNLPKCLQHKGNTQHRSTELHARESLKCLWVQKHLQSQMATSAQPFARLWPCCSAQSHPSTHT